MSQENVELVRRLLPPPEVNLVTDVLFRGDDAGWKAYEREQLLPWFTDDFSGVAHIGGSTASFRGLRGWRDGWLDWLEPWESYRTEIVRVLDAGHCVLVRGRDFGRHPGMEAEIELPGASNVWTFRMERSPDWTTSPTRPKPSKPPGCRSRAEAQKHRDARLS
jgi:hypothetical protein